MDVNVTKQNLLAEAKKATNLDKLNKRIEEIIDLVVEKNRAYGDAWQLYGPLTALIRIREKLVRLDNVTAGEDGELEITVKSCNAAKEELRDIIGYSLLALLWIDTQDCLIEDLESGIQWDDSLRKTLGLECEQKSNSQYTRMEVNWCPDYNPVTEVQEGFEPGKVVDCLHAKGIKMKGFCIECGKLVIE